MLVDAVLLCASKETVVGVRIYSGLSEQACRDGSTSLGILRVNPLLSSLPWHCSCLSGCFCATVPLLAAQHPPPFLCICDGIMDHVGARS